MFSTGFLQGMNHTQIHDQLWVGSHPRTPQDLTYLKEQLEITAVMNLQTDEDFEQWDIDWEGLRHQYPAQGIVLRRVPVRDFDSDDLQRKLRDCVAALDSLCRANHTVYLHCTAGVGRSPSVAIAYFVLVQKCTLEEAVSRVRDRHPCSPDLRAIEGVIVESRRGPDLEPTSSTPPPGK
jgi:protein-tyrosine phosphatase